MAGDGVAVEEGTVNHTLVELIYGAEDDRPTEWYVRGHAAEHEAVAIVREWLEAGAEFGERDDVPQLGGARHRWARWGLGWDEYGEIVPRRFYVRDAPSRGAFPVTEVRDLDDLERRRLARARELAHAAELEALTLVRYPEATEIRPNGYPPGEGSVWFRLPGLQGEVRWNPSGGTFIQQRDVEAWNQLYAHRSGAPRSDR